jgi:DNA-binding transcriptional LysR family regulator
MRTDDLKLFLTVIDHSSLHQAAATTGVSQSALSKVLARLEEESGMILLERTARGIALTPSGTTLAAHARKVTLALHDMERELNDQRLARAGKVRLATLPYLIPSLLSPLLARFFVSRPLAAFSIETHLSPRLIGALQAGEVDLVCGATPVDVPPGISWLSLGPVTLQIVTRVDHPRRDRLQRLADLGAERWALPAASVYLRQALDERFQALGLPPPHVAVESTTSPTAFAELLRHSDLLGLLPPRFLKQADGHGLAALDGPGMAWQHELAVCWRSAGYLSPLARDFRDAMVEWCAQSGV